MSEDEVDSVGKIAYLTEEERAGIINCLNRRNGVFQDPDFDLALALLGSDQAWVEQSLRYPAIYYADITRRHEFESAMGVMIDAISQVQHRRRECCAD